MGGMVVGGDVLPSRAVALRVPVVSTPLVTFDEDDALWQVADIAAAARALEPQLCGALVRLVPPPEHTQVQVQQVKAELVRRGARSVRVQPNRRVRQVDAGGRLVEATAPVPTVQAVVDAMIAEAHCDGFERDELREAVEQALTEGGL